MKIAAGLFVGKDRLGVFIRQARKAPTIPFCMTFRMTNACKKESAIKQTDRARR
ncbi:MULTISPECIES: hypothetical protein [Paraburkholderia]|uniref:hypothetical protein n=1 Tax=Paraburkholderia TaxID=1822464 RepID=UPI0032189CCF